jgi:molecular chaperone DnaK
VNSNILSIESMLANMDNTQITKDKTFIGIDFGTSTTVVSVASFDKQEHQIKTKVLQLEQLLEDGTHYKSEKIPTVIAWYNKILLVGEGASNLKYHLTKGKNIWYSFKMEIGEDLGAKYYNSEVGDMEAIKIRNPKDCVRIFFMYLKMLIERYCKDNGISTNISYAVSIPASFEANQRKELMEALETNGMSLFNQSLIDEPNAAFISYVHESQESNHPLLISPHYNSKCLVFDFGGGTCDISILEIGKSVNGFFSKNIAISKFTKLGGDDLDRYLTYHYILPRFLEKNGLKPSDFITKERAYIATQLYKVAERLKILICEKISSAIYDFDIPSTIKIDKNPITISTKVVAETIKGDLVQNEFYLTPAEFSEAMNVFLKSQLPTQIRGEEEYNNIFMPISSAIKKANIRLDELDYILLIGGSAQNPYIQEALRKYFTDSKILVPQDLQTHVSKGAAIHSFLINGMNKCIIQPITSEPILIITKDRTPKILMPAGTQIPSDVKTVDDLLTSRDKQEIIELPICVGSPNKLLFNLKISREGGFPLHTPVIVNIGFTADKLMLVQAECLGVRCLVEPQNPFANKELSTEERIVLVAERQANLEAEINKGIPSKASLIKLREAYEKAGQDFKAAETYEQQMELYPNPSEYNSIGVLYHNSGNYEKAIEFYKRALQNNPEDFHATFNLGCTLEGRDNTRAEKYLRKAYSMNSQHAPTLIELADIEESNGNQDKAKEMCERAYDILLRKWKANTLADSEYSWLSSVARKLGQNDMANAIMNSRTRLEGETLYNDNNLTESKKKEIEKI